MQYKFNEKIQDNMDDVKAHLKANAVGKAKASVSAAKSMITEWQKRILFIDKSEEKYTQHELAGHETYGRQKDSQS